ncbi:MAG: ATP-binding protein, partial [Nitrospinota bacterium]
SAQGLKIAKELGIPITLNYMDLLLIKGLDMIINLTGDPLITSELEKENKEGIDILGGLGARLLWDLVYTEKKREEKLYKKLELAVVKLNDMKNYLENILEHSADMIITTDTDMNIVSFNKGAEKILGYKREDVIGTDIKEIWFDKDEQRELTENVIKKGDVSSYETRFVTKGDGYIYISLTLSQLKDDSNKVIGTVGISKDITEKKKLEKELIESNQELENFVYTVSHDLKAPLRTIDGFATILLDDYKDKLDRDGRHYLARIRNAASHMGRLIRDLLELSRIGKVANPHTRVSVLDILNKVKEVLRYNLEDNKAELNIVSSLPSIRCDRVRMVQMLSNLISNAIKFVDKNKTPKIEIGYKDKKTYYEFYVKDNGIGIEMEYLSSIFDIFHRLHNSEEYGGTGIGLTIVKRIIELHNGNIWVKSKMGEGSTFYFTIPKD